MWIMYVKYYYISPYMSAVSACHAFEIIEYIDFAYAQIRMHFGKLQGSGETVQSWSQIVIWKVISRFEDGQGSNLCTLKLQDLGRPRVALNL